MLKAAGKKGKSDRARDLVCGTRVFNAFGGCTCICWIAAKLPLRERGPELGCPVRFFSGRRAFVLGGPPWRHVMLQRFEFHCMMMMMMMMVMMMMMMMVMMLVMAMMYTIIPDHHFNGAEPSGLVELWSGARGGGDGELCVGQAL